MPNAENREQCITVELRRTTGYRGKGGWSNAGNERTARERIVTARLLIEIVRGKNRNRSVYVIIGNIIILRTQTVRRRAAGTDKTRVTE